LALLGVPWELLSLDLSVKFCSITNIGYLSLNLLYLKHPAFALTFLIYLISILWYNLVGYIYWLGLALGSALGLYWTFASLLESGGGALWLGNCLGFQAALLDLSIRSLHELLYPCWIGC